MPMTDVQLAKWGERYGLTLANVKALRRHVNAYAKEQEHYCNGDPHPSRPTCEDKNVNAKLWANDSEGTAVLLDALAARFGFKVDYGVGLYPALMRDGEDCIMIPE